MKLFVVLMRRWGDKENHHYIIGAYSNKELAEKEGLKDHVYRSGKYDPTIVECELDGNIDNITEKIFKLDLTKEIIDFKDIITYESLVEDQTKPLDSPVANVKEEDVAKVQTEE